ncbi:MAG: hypothetical protein RI962_1248 [Pseudomonadota bacterium]|jgi:hypothetical protein
MIALPAPTDPCATDQVVALTRAWVEHVVIGLNLCPFAKPVHVRQQIEYRVSTATDEAALSQDLLEAMMALVDIPSTTTDTCLLIHPWVLQDFIHYNDFLDVADSLLEEADLSGILQVASFHPGYRFAGTDADDITNCTNRSPFPMLHLLREASLDKAAATLLDASEIVERNLTTLRNTGHSGWEALQQRVIHSASPPANTQPATDSADHCSSVRRE